MKLELKHYSSYLPYDVKVVNFQNSIFTLKGISSDGSLLSEGGYFIGDIESSRLALRRWPDLTKEIEVNGERFVPMEYLSEQADLRLDECNKMYLDYYHIGETDSPFSGYNIISKLIEWHFDVFGLIEKGLAIDINLNSISK